MYGGGRSVRKNGGKIVGSVGLAVLVLIKIVLMRYKRFFMILNDFNVDENSFKLF